MNISKICRMLDSQAKIQKVKRSLQKSRLSGSFRRTCLLRPVILILESPEKCVKPQISVPQPQTSSFSGSVQRPSICTCHTSSDGAAAPTPGTAQGTTDLLPVQWAVHPHGISKINWFDFWFFFSSSFSLSSPSTFKLNWSLLRESQRCENVCTYNGNLVPCKLCPLFCQPDPQRGCTIHSQVYSRHLYTASIPYVWIITTPSTRIGTGNLGIFSLWGIDQNWN